MSDQHFRFLCFGAGAIGTYIGSSLLQIGQEVVFLERPEIVEKLTSEGLTLVLEDADHYEAGGVFVSTLDQALMEGPFDAAIVAVKSYDTPGLIEMLAPYRTALPIFLCFQNGVENEFKFAEVLGEERVIAGTITSAIRRVDAGSIVLERKRGVGLAGNHPLIEPLLEIFNRAGLSARVYTNAASMKWSKLITNLITNASSAILDMKPSVILADKLAFHYERLQMREALAVMKALGYPVIDLPGTSVRAFAWVLEHLSENLTRIALKDALGAGRGGKMPSFYIDLHSGRGKSEVSALNGAVVRFGQQVGVPTPVNELLTRTLQDLTAGLIPLDTYAGNPKKLYQTLGDIE